MPLDEHRMSSWSCEIGSVPFYRIPEYGDLPFRKAVQDCWGTMFPEVESDCSSGWGRITPSIETRSIAYEANLGCATTEELFRELIARFTLHPKAVGQLISVERAVVLAEMLGSLDNMDKHYRTID